MVRWVFVIALAAMGLGMFLGYRWNSADLATSAAKVSTLAGERDLAREVARSNAQSLTSLRDTLNRERERHQLMRAAADRELGARAERIAQLTKDATLREIEARKKAAADEDCVVLRDLPVCAAVADRLRGGSATARPH